MSRNPYELDKMSLTELTTLGTDMLRAEKADEFDEFVEQLEKEAILKKIESLVRAERALKTFTSAQIDEIRKALQFAKPASKAVKPGIQAYINLLRLREAHAAAKAARAEAAGALREVMPQRIINLLKRVRRGKAAPKFVEEEVTRAAPGFVEEEVARTVPRSKLRKVLGYTGASLGVGGLGTGGYMLVRRSKRKKR